MKHQQILHFYTRLLQSQQPRFGIHPQDLLQQLDELMQWSQADAPAQPRPPAGKKEAEPHA